jgi:tetratricopeptide (TPR) repeat protein
MTAIFRSGPIPRTLGFRCFPIVAVLVALALATSCGGPEQKEAEHLKRGKELYEEGNYVKARLEFKNALQINPDRVEAYYYMGLIEVREGNLQKAFYLFKLTSERQQDNFDAQLKVAQFYLAAGELDKAQKQLDVLSSLNQGNVEVLAFASALAFRREQFAEARQHAEAALAKDSGHAAATILLVRTLHRVGEPDLALSRLEQALQRRPEDTALLQLKAGILLQEQRFTEAEAAYRNLIEIDPSNVGHRLALAQLLVRLDRIDAAEATLRQSASDNVGGLETRFALVELLASKKGLAAAEAELLQLIKENPREYAYFLKLAELYANNGQFDHAVMTLETLIEQENARGTEPIGANGVAARIALARLRLGSNDPQAAAALTEEVIRTDPANPEALLIRAGVALLRGDVKSTITDLRTVLRNNPDSKAALRMLAHAQLLEGDIDLAMDALRRLVELDPNDNEARQRLASLLAYRGNQQAAMKLLDEVLRNQPKSAPSLQAKASLLIAQGKWDEAEATIAQLLRVPDQQGSGHTLSGALEMARGRFPEAVEAFEKARQAAPRAAEPLTGLVQALLLQHELESATSYLEAVVAEMPDLAVAHNLFGELFVRQKRPADAEIHFRHAMKLAAKWAVPYLNLGQLFVASGRPSDGVDVYRSGLVQVPGNIQLLLAMAEAYERSKEFDAAMQTYEQILATSPEIDAAANNLAALIADFRNHDPDRLKRALGLVARFENSRNPYFVDTLGWVQFRLGDLRRARDNLQRAVLLNPEIPQLQYHFGMVLYRLGETALARDALEKAVDADVDYFGVEEARTTLANL